MKIEKIEANKIRVILSELDLIDMNINVKALTPDSPRLHGFLYEIMEKVKAQTGFNPYSGQVVVEATPNRDGITLTVTKLFEKTAQKRKRPQNIRAVIKKAPPKITYSFSSFEDICSLFSVSDAESFCSGKLYEYMEKFYIIIPKNANSQIHEFANAEGGFLFGENFLSEHGKLHAEKDDLVNMAKGVKNLMN